MILRTTLGAALALLIVSAAPAVAQERDGSFIGGLLPGVFGSRSDRQEEVPAVMAQAGDPRITQLEEQIRQLSGTVEELNFQLLQMQEQMRKMQEDNEFRFQQIEEKKSDTGAASTAGQTAKAETPDVVTTPKAGRAGSEPAAPGDGMPMETDGPTVTPGEPEKTFGTITFDDKGNPSGATNDAGADGTVVAALPPTDDPEELYRNSYQFILSGDYATAEAGFRDHVARFPADTRTADAHFWLGESLLGQQKYREAAEIFLAANRDFPSSKKAPDMLLKLGVSLAGLNQRDVACATFSEVGKRYPSASGALKERVKQEQALAAC
jgi:tol-pal system protein YbgF